MINSILDSDFYKYTMQWAVLNLYPTVQAEYSFINRNKEKFNIQAFDAIRCDIADMAKLRLTQEEREGFEKACSFLPPSYFEFLQNYRFNPKEVSISLTGGDLNISISGLWHRTILWEVPLMAIISENYFKYVDTNWVDDEIEQCNKIRLKGTILRNANCNFADFGTRRRRNYKTQDLVVKSLTEHFVDKNHQHYNFPNFVGTSNVHFALKYNTRPIGTLAHEFIQAHQVLGGIRHSNQYAMKAWMNVYQGELGTALTDTIGTDMFYEDFDPVLSRLFDSVRHDSGDAFVFIDKTINHYKKHRINPITKTIIFSDGLNPEEAIKISQYCENKIKCSFGIGTNLTNHYESSKPLNIVIKLVKINEIPVVKLSDVSTKAIGDKDAIRVTKWIIDKTPLDATY